MNEARFVVEDTELAQRLSRAFSRAEEGRVLGRDTRDSAAAAKSYCSASIAASIWRLCGGEAAIAAGDPVRAQAFAAAIAARVELLRSIADDSEVTDG